jgi:hypothetical protein
LSTHTDCSSERRIHAVSIYAPCYTPAGPRYSHAIPLQPPSLERTKAIPAIQLYRIFIATVGFDLPMEHLGSIRARNQKILRRKIPSDHRTRR